MKNINLTCPKCNEKFEAKELLQEHFLMFDKQKLEMLEAEKELKNLKSNLKKQSEIENQNKIKFQTIKIEAKKEALEEHNKKIASLKKTIESEVTAKISPSIKKLAEEEALKKQDAMLNKKVIQEVNLIKNASEKEIMEIKKESQKFKLHNESLHNQITQLKKKSLQKHNI